MAHAHGPAEVIVDAGKVNDVTDLRGHIALNQVAVLNADESCDAASVFSLAGGLLKSDADVDHQLLLHVPFVEKVKLRGIRIGITHDEKDDDSQSGPKVLKLFVNANNLDFDGAATEPETQRLDLTDADLSNQEIRLKFVKFQSVSSLTIFVESNVQDSAVTRINALGFIGSPIAGFHVADIKKIDDGHDH